MSYYSVTGAPVQDTRGVSPSIRAEFVLIAAGFAALPVQAAIWGGSANYGVDTGAADAYVVSIAATYIVSYTDGLTIKVYALNANTGAATINLNTLGIKSIVRPDGTALSAGDIVAGGVMTLTYSTTLGKFQLAISGVASATAAAASAATATTQAGIATTQAGTATTQAGIATTQAGLAAGSATTAANYLTVGTSTTSVAIATGAKSFTATTGKPWGAGQFLTLASAANTANYMHGTVTSYNATTGALVMNILDIGGSGTLADWGIAVSGTQGPTGPTGATGPAGSAGDHAVTVTTGNGHGSTNTTIRRFTTTQSSVGTAITYADSATLGASFTINEAGLYEIYYLDALAGTATAHGISLNSSQLTTSIDLITAADRLGITTSGTIGSIGLTRVVRLAATDVIRPHDNGSNTNATAQGSSFSIRKVGV